MNNALLDKARAILAQPKPDRAPITEPAVTDATSDRMMPANVLPTRSASASEGFQIEPAALNAKAIYWEASTGRILGPAVPEFLARDGNTFWISTTFEGQILWINADRLRSRKAFEQQPEVLEFNPIR